MNCPLCNGKVPDVLDHLCAPVRAGGHARQPDEARRVVERFDGNLPKDEDLEFLGYC